MQGFSYIFCQKLYKNPGAVLASGFLWSQKGMILRLPDYDSGAITNRDINSCRKFETWMEVNLFKSGRGVLLACHLQGP